MDGSILRQVTLIVKQRLGDEFTELLNRDEHYRRLISERASLCQRLAQGEVAIFDQYVEIDEEIMEIETHHAYLMGVSETELFQKLKDEIGPVDWNKLVTKCTNQFGCKLDEDNFIKPKHMLKSRRLIRVPLVALFAGILLLIVTGACLPITIYYITQGDTFTRVASGPVELLDTLGEGSFRSMEEAAQSYGLERVAPTWVPKQYTLDSVGTNDEDGYTSLYAWYVSDSDSQQGISVRIVCYQQAESMVEKYEMEVEGGEEHFTDGIRYFVTQNKQSTRAVWLNGNCLCSISGPVSENDIEQMIKSTKW